MIKITPKKNWSKQSEDKSIHTVKTKGSKKKNKIKRKILKAMKSDAEISNIENFSHKELESLVVTSKSTYFGFAGKLKKKYIQKENGEIYVLINTGHNIFYKIPLKIYRKLCKIRYISINMAITIDEDGYQDENDEIDEDKRIFYSTKYNISSINKLFNYAIKRIGFIESVAMYQQGPGWYSNVNKEEIVSILYTNGEVDKMNWYEFASRYHTALLNINRV